MPMAFDGTLLIVVVTLLEMSLDVSIPAGHRANREHSQTLALFEIRDQQGEVYNWHADGFKSGETPHCLNQWNVSGPLAVN